MDATRKERRTCYQAFRKIDGTHDFKKAVPEGYVDYFVRRRKGGKVAYFNFELAKEMGLIPQSHKSKLTPSLAKAILGTFSIQIINEYDLAHNLKVPKNEIKANKYMATRYLQLQHPDKKGETSGDGRSIWNGQIRHNGVTWDISSCGTGATRLSPATAIENKFFKTGDPQVSYGCGYSDLLDGLCAAIMSEIFHKNNIPTERTLAVIEFPNNLSINVRAAKTLLRPSHFFHHLKQSKVDRLRSAIDYFIDRQIANGEWKSVPKKDRYAYMAEEIAKAFGRATALFEAEYIFVWMDWDGDNILADGGIIDYGSVRQFGLFHHQYRYDDVDRWSTTIPEQKQKARYLVQTFAQIRDYLMTGKKRPIKEFRNDKTLKIFDREFNEGLLNNLLYKIGLKADEREYIFKHHKPVLKKFKSIHSYFEKAKSSRGKVKTSDGTTWDAIFCMRDILRDLPIHLLSKDRPATPAEFMDIIASSYANKNDRKLTTTRCKQMKAFQDLYLKLLDKVANHFGTPIEKLLLNVSKRSAIINRYDRVTGDSILSVTEQILKDKKRLKHDQVQSIIEDFISYQQLSPGTTQSKLEKMNVIENRRSERIMNKLYKLVHDYRDSI